MSLLAVAALVDRPALLAAEEAAPEALELAFVDFVDLPATSASVLKAEARAILAPHGRDLRWRTWEPGTELEAGEVPVVLLAGHHPVPRRRGVVLGGVVPRAVRPSVWVYVQAVGRAVGATWPPANADDAGQQALGVALGRVVAHELVHAVARQTIHTAGLMGPVLDRRALIGDRPRLDPVAAASFRGSQERRTEPGSGDPRSAGLMALHPLTEPAADENRPPLWRCSSGP